MTKIYKLFLPLFLLLTPLLASDKSYSFIGIQTGASKIDKNYTPSIGLKYGIQKDNARTSLIYSYDKKSNKKLQMLLLQVDMGIFNNAFKNSYLKPYLGATFGVLEEKRAKLTRDRGYVYGLNTGLAYILNGDFDIDLGYRYLKTSKLKNIDEINNLNLSMHYFY